MVNTRTNEALSPADLQLRNELSDGLAFVRARETVKALGAVTFEELIAEQIFFLDDNEAGDRSDSEFAPSTQMPHGYLQEVEGIENRLLGSEGAIARARDLLNASDQ
jgi:hypothetical protein